MKQFIEMIVTWFRTLIENIGSIFATASQNPRSIAKKLPNNKNTAATADTKEVNNSTDQTTAPSPTPARRKLSLRWMPRPLTPQERMRRIIIRLIILITVVIIMIAAVAVPEFEETYPTLYALSTLVGSLIEKLFGLVLGAIHSLINVFKHPMDVAENLSPLGESFNKLIDVLKNIWSYISTY